ncbi:MAG: CBS domain-containing protein [Povalibacter sp.]
MRIDQYCKRAVVAIGGRSDIAEAAQLMRDRHVGFLVVFDESDHLRRPIGVLTDRDIVLEVTALDVDPHAVTVRDIMTRQPMIARESDDLGELMQGMRIAGIRRVPVVDSRGGLTGVIAVDDVIDVVSELMGDIAASIKTEQRQEWRARRSLLDQATATGNHAVL